LGLREEGVLFRIAIECLGAGGVGGGAVEASDDA